MPQPPNRRRDQDQQKNTYDRLSSSHRQDQDEQLEYEQPQYVEQQPAQHTPSDPAQSNEADYGKGAATLDPPAGQPAIQPMRYNASATPSANTPSHNSDQTPGDELLRQDASRAPTYQPPNSASAFFDKMRQDEQPASAQQIDDGQAQDEQMSYGSPQSQSAYGSTKSAYGAVPSSYGSTESPYGRAEQQPYGEGQSSYGAAQSRYGAELQYAGVWQRAIALIIDSILVGIAMALISSVFGIGRPNPYTGEATGGLSFLTFVLYMGYFIYMEGTRGATFGKQLLGLRVIRVDGQRLGIGKVAIRNLLRVVDQFLFGLVGFFCIVVTPRKQRLGDLAAKTIVVKSGKRNL